MSEGKKLRWGIISTAGIGMGQVTPAIQKSAHSEVVAIASRDLEKSRIAAAKLGIARPYGSYEALLADPDVDAVYIPLPNHLHVDLAIAAAEAGKHVLCEKPIALDRADAERLRACPDDVTVAEAFMIRYHPQWQRARDIARSGELGELRAIHAAFSYFNDDPENVRNQADIGGGAILDIGCYPVVGARYLFEAEPTRVVSLIDRDPNFKIDRTVSVIADFGSGRQLSFVVSTQAVPYQSIALLGTKKRVEIVIPFNAPSDNPTAILVDDGSSLDASLSRREIIPACDHYTEQAEAFALAVLAGKKLDYGIEDAILNMRVLDAIFESEKISGWAKV